MPRPQVDGQAAEAMAQAIAHQQSGGDGPEDVAQQPVQAAAVELARQAAALTDQQQGGDDEGKAMPSLSPASPDTA